MVEHASHSPAQAQAAEQAEAEHMRSILRTQHIWSSVQDRGAERTYPQGILIQCT